MRISRRLLIISVGILTFFALSGYWFFMHTNRGSSLALYIFAGIRAPISVKIDCAYSTDARVEEKFQRPLAFDKKSIDALRGFWYYDYFRECLFTHGYDFAGRAIPETGITDGMYRNPFVGIEFAVPDDAVIVQDNVLDVDFDDHLYESGISTGGHTIVIHAYLNDSTKQTTDAMTGFSTSSEDIVSRESVRNPSGVDVVSLTGTLGTSGFLFRTSNDWSVYIFGTEPFALEIGSVLSSLRFLP